MSYYRPVDLASALEILARSGGKIIAGGTDVFPAAKQGVKPDYFLDVTGISGLSDISFGDYGTRIGASVTWSQILQREMPSAFDGLKQAATEVGSVQIQNAATIAGNLCNASPAADGIPPLLTLDAQVELVSAERGKRIIGLADFIHGVRQTDRAEDEILTAIIVPPVCERAKSAFEKLGSRRYLVISITMSAAVVSCDASGRITDARLSVGACSPVAQRLFDLEADLVGKSPEEVVVTPRHLKCLSPIDDVRGSGSFRIDVVAEQCQRAILKALAYG